MAVVFISPKQRQKMLIQGIVILFILFIVSITLTVFLSKPKRVSQNLVFNKPKVTIDIKIFESDLFKDLKPFPKMGIQFSYEAYDKNKKKVKGVISADSKEGAEKLLKAMDLEIISLKEVEAGRENPFAPYFGL